MYKRMTLSECHDLYAIDNPQLVRLCELEDLIEMGNMITVPSIRETKTDSGFELVYFDKYGQIKSEERRRAVGLCQKEVESFN